MDINHTLKWVIGTCSAIGILWYLGFVLHRWNLRGFYGKIAMNVKSIKKGVDIEGLSKKERLLKLFFYRQITYEYSAYALLVICIGFLIASIYIFLMANQYVPLEINKQPLTVSQYLVSIVSIRVGIALVIFFICQVLLKLYRYCLRFSAFYTGLFDALFIYEDLGKEIADAIQLFAVKENLEEGPESPTDKAIEILKEVNKLK